MIKDTSRIERERLFHDERFSGGADKRGGLRGIYRITRTSKHHFSRLVESYADNSDVIEIGVGLESLLPLIFGKCRSFRGIDISVAAVEEARSRFKAYVRSGVCELTVCDAEDTHLPGKSAGLVFGAGIVHHLEMRRFIGELKRLLTPDGRAVFFEPLGHNPLVNLFRLLTPHLRSTDEHPLSEHDLDMFREAFREVRIKYFHLVSLVLVPLCRFSIFDKFYSWSEAFDSWIFSNFPMTRRFSWVVVIECAGPKDDLR